MLSLAEIKAFQRKNGLVVDGILGPQTRKVMQEVKRPPSASARKEPDKSAINTPVVPDAKSVSGSARWKGQIALADTARTINEVIFHCTATPEGKWFDRADVNAWHKQRGWAMIGYHFLILLDGTIVVGRPIGMIGAHVAGHNNGTIGVAYVGGLTKDGRKAKDTRTAAQMAAAQWLIGALKSQFKISRRTRGHNEYDRGKACPSFNVGADMLGAI